MKINLYESVVIINAALEDNQIEESLANVERIIKENGGAIKDVNNWGRKRLAYPINKSKSGYYSVCTFQAPSDSIKKIERAFRLDETVIRYLTVLMDNEAQDNFWRKKEKQKEEKVAETAAVNEDSKLEVETKDSESKD
ncbi:MAG: 30S ribosomal protein S6 [Ignavibacteria bacterium]|jgi:small subunit ribosomal protein S6